MPPSKASHDLHPGDFSRGNFVKKIRDNSILWDIIIIGGGATGLGVAVDGASRGYKTLLLEQSDFAKATSSRSTKLIHGGVRYLAQGDIKLVYEGLYERGLLLKNAPHLVSMQPFVIPCYSLLQKIVYGFGLKVYDWMAGKYRLKKTKFLNKDETEHLLPGIRTKGLTGGILYYDGQFDDARLAVNLAQTSAGQGGVVLNYFKVTELHKNDAGMISGVKAVDVIDGQEYSLKAKTVVNATGIFVNEIVRMDNPSKPPIVKFSQGVHLVFNKSLLNGAALMLPKTSDGRVLFAVPWNEHVIAGTTDTPLKSNHLEPVALENEVQFILDTIGKYLVKKPERKDILSIFAGLRPLAAKNNSRTSTKDISRAHRLITGKSGLITITGGKWTTYRKMAEDTVNEVIKVGELKNVSCKTDLLPIHGFMTEILNDGQLSCYGADALLVRKLVSENPVLGERLHESFPNIKAEVLWAVRNEMAVNVEDVLARRLRILFLDAKAAMAMASEVAEIMAHELQKDDQWKHQQIEAFNKLAKGYLPVNLDEQSVK